MENEKKTLGQKLSEKKGTILKVTLIGVGVAGGFLLVGAAFNKFRPSAVAELAEAAADVVEALPKAA